jgi:hypothetical protein
MKWKVLKITFITAFALSALIFSSQVGVATEPDDRWYALGYDDVFYTLGCKANNTVYWPYVEFVGDYPDFVSESVWCTRISNGYLQGAEVGWRIWHYDIFKFYVYFVVDDVYYGRELPRPNPIPGDNHTFEVRDVVEGYAPTNVWRAYIDGVLKEEMSLNITYADNYIAQSESTNTVNEFDGHFWNLKWGGLSAPPYPGGPRYFIWLPWYSTQWYDDYPYDVIPSSDTEFNTEGP